MCLKNSTKFNGYDGVSLTEFENYKIEPKFAHFCKNKNPAAHDCYMLCNM